MWPGIIYEGVNSTPWLGVLALGSVISLNCLIFPQHVRAVMTRQLSQRSTGCLFDELCPSVSSIGHLLGPRMCHLSLILWTVGS